MIKFSEILILVKYKEKVFLVNKRSSIVGPPYEIIGYVTNHWFTIAVDRYFDGNSSYMEAILSSPDLSNLGYESVRAMIKIDEIINTLNKYGAHKESLVGTYQLGLGGCKVYKIIRDGSDESVHMELTRSFRFSKVKAPIPGHTYIRKEDYEQVVCLGTFKDVWIKQDYSRKVVVITNRDLRLKDKYIIFCSLVYCFIKQEHIEGLRDVKEINDRDMLEKVFYILPNTSYFCDIGPTRLCIGNFNKVFFDKTVKYIGSLSFPLGILRGEIFSSRRIKSKYLRRIMRRDNLVESNVRVLSLPYLLEKDDLTWCLNNSIFQKILVNYYSLSITELFDRVVKKKCHRII